jgi:serine protease AprX
MISRSFGTTTVLALGILLIAAPEAAPATPASAAVGAVRREPHAAYAPPAARAPEVLGNAALARLRVEGRSVLWVFFTDKGERDAASFARAVQEAGSRVSPRARARRARETGGRFVPDYYDVPVAPSYVEAVAGTGAALRHVSKWLNAVSVEASEAEARRIAALPFVRLVEAARRSSRVKPVSESAPTPGGSGSEGLEAPAPLGAAPEAPEAAGAPAAVQAAQALNPPATHTSYGNSFTQLDKINVIAAQDSGWSAAGVVVAMFDTGFNKSHNATVQLKRLAEHDFVFGDGETANQPGDVSSQWDHGTGTWSVLGGYWPSNLFGPAYNASFLLAKTEDERSETPVEEDNWVAAVEWADSLGVDVISSSLAYFYFDSPYPDYTYSDLDGYTTVVSLGAIMAERRGIVVANAMANSGPGAGSLQAPADADSILSCGAVDFNDNIAPFSSRGPTADGRTKPEVVAQGVSTWWAVASINNALGTADGTSLSTPLVGGAAALVREAHPEWTPAEVRQALMETADKASTPDNNYGWGRIDVVQAIYGSSLGGPVYPRPFNLLVPPNGNTVLSSPVTFRWRRTLDADNPATPCTYTLHLRSITADSTVFTTTTTDTFAVYSGYLGPSRTYDWYVTAEDNMAHGRDSRDHFQFLTGSTTGVGITPPPSPPAVVLYQNYPNPVRSGTVIEFTMTGPVGAEPVTLRLYDARGRLVRTLFDGYEGIPVRRSFQWDGLMENGVRAGSGIYYYELDVAGTRQSKRLVLLR